jgi:phosphoglycerate kinase
MSLGRQTVRDLRLGEGARVLVRVDFNVPLAGGRVLDATRVASSLPTINYLRERGCRVVLMSHLGRPKGKPDPAFSLAPVGALLAERLGDPVAFVPCAVGPEAEASTQSLRPGQVALLENVRFFPGDEADDPAFAAQLARHGEVYVNDAFGAAHRAHASTSGVAAYLPAVAGLLMERELEVLGGLLANPARPFLVVMGGSKVSDKLGVITSLLARCDILALGGGMANSFLAAKGAKLGRSLLETDLIPKAGELLAEAVRRGVEVILPTDRIVAADLHQSDPPAVMPADAIPDHLAGFDIGPASAGAIAAAAARSRTIFWNSPVGVYEVPRFANGTAAVAAGIAAATRAGATSIAAGGDTLAAVAAAGLEAQFSHLSTGGGASLELLEGRPLPGVTCLLGKGEVS